MVTHSRKVPKRIGVILVCLHLIQGAPTFISTPAATTYAQIGSNVLLSWTFQYSRLPSFRKWFKSTESNDPIGKSIMFKSGNNPELIKNTAFEGRAEFRENGGLLIKNVSLNDEGYIAFSVDFEDGESLSTKTMLNVTIPPSISSALPNQVIATEGLPSTLRCTFEARPIPTIKWYLDGILLVNGSKYKIESQITGYRENQTTVQSSLTINKVVPGDSGNISCAADIPFGELSTSSYFLVHYPPKNVTFSSDKSNNIAVLGENILFTCDATSIPNAFYQFYYNNALLTNTTNQTITIKNVGVSNEGNYKCLARNYLGSSNSTLLNVTVHVPPVLYSHSDDVTTAIKNSSVSLSCIFYGEPAPKISWYKIDGNTHSKIASKSSALQVNSSFSIIESKIFFAAVQRWDHGLYRCKANNTVGNKERNITLNVTYAPVFTRRMPISSLIPLGTHNYTIQCTVISNPASTIQWHVNETAFVSSSQISHTMMTYSSKNHTEITSTLTIMAIQKHHFSNYSCAASNSLGKANAKMLLIVTYKPELTASSPNQIVANATSKMKMACEFESNPASNIYWNRKLFDEIRFSPILDGNVTILQSSLKFQKFKSEVDVKSLHRSHSGIYTCGANNSLGREEKNITLIVNFAPQNLTYLQERYIKLDSSGSFELECIFEAKPEAIVTWLYNNSSPDTTLFNITETVLSNDIFYVRKRSVLKIDSVKENIQGVYQCIASNHQGNFTQSTHLVVLYKPILLSSLPQSIVRQKHQNISINCKVRSNGMSSIVWYKDDKEIFPNKRISMINKNISVDANLDAYNSITESELNVYNVAKDDSGNYTCAATNNVGSIFDNTRLIVHYAPITKESFSPIENVSESNSPYFLKCLVEANPIPAIHWYYNSEIYLGNVTNVVRSSNDTLNIVESTLSFKDGIKRSNNGTYNCNATNSIGSDVKSVTMNVWYGPDFLSDLKGTINTTKSSNVSFTCRAEGHLAPVLRWYKSNALIMGVPVQSMRMSDTKTVVSSTLTLTDVTKNSTAEYHCEVTNVVVSKIQAVHLNVLYEPVLPVVPPNITANQSQKVELNCFVDANPPVLQYEWTKDGSPLSHIGPVYQILSAQENSAGIYVCSPKYSLGATPNVTFDLRIQVPAFIRSMTCNPTLKELACRCVGHGIPTPEIFWTKDNQTSILATGEVFNTVIQKGNYGSYHCHAKNKLAEQIKTFNLFVIDDSVGPWTVWGSCNVSCGAGFQNRTRPCKLQSVPCSELLQETKACNGSCFSTTPSVNKQAQKSSEDETWSIVLYILIPVLAVLCIVLLVWLANSRGCRREEKEFIVPLNNSLSQPPSIRSMPTRRGIYLPDNNFGVLNSGYRPDGNDVQPSKDPRKYDTVEVEMQFGNEGSESTAEGTGVLPNGGDYNDIPGNGNAQEQENLSFYNSAYTHL